MTVLPETSSNRTTYASILKSTAAIGGSSLVTIAFGIVRVKVIAVLLGPAGVGLFGVYNSVVELAQSVGSLGTASSGVRQIAEAVGSADSSRIARTAAVLRRMSVVLGVASAAVLALGAIPVSVLTFGTGDHAAGIALLALAVFFRLVSGGQAALIQGMRRISDLAMMNILAALCSTVFSIPLVYLYGERGIVPSLVAMAAVSALVSWGYRRRIRIEPVPMTGLQARREAAALLRLGFSFLASGLMTLGAAYAIRIIVLRQIGFDAAGLYQAAWSLGGLYAGFVLQAMGTDFYPRLTAVSQDDEACNRMVNEQARVSMLLAGPGINATLTIAPLVMTLFYSSDFAPAVGLLRWLCLGMMLRIVAWPMGFIVLAKGRQQIFFWTEVAATLVHVGLAWWLVGLVGLDGAGIAFFGLYVWHGILIYLVSRHISGFRWTHANRILGIRFLSMTAVVFAGFQWLPPWPALVLGLCTTAASGLYSLRIMGDLLDAPSPVRHLLSRLTVWRARRG